VSYKNVKISGISVTVAHSFSKAKAADRPCHPAFDSFNKGVFYDDVSQVSDRDGC